MITILRHALNRTLEIQEKGRSRKITMREGIILRVINEALKGNLKAADYVLSKEAEIARSLTKTQRIHRGMTPQEAANAWAEIVRADKEREGLL